jgi:hypothetical protein
MPVLYDAADLVRRVVEAWKWGAEREAEGFGGGSAAADGSEADVRPDERRVAGREVVGKSNEGGRGGGIIKGEEESVLGMVSSIIE